MPVFNQKILMDESQESYHFLKEIIMITLAALITPMLIASEPMAITIDEIQTKYSHDQQTVVSLNDTPISIGTVNGTQTYDWQGHPNDSDHD